MDSIKEGQIDSECVECLGCANGIKMCRVPCWGSPEEIDRLIARGMGRQLSIDFYIDDNFEVVEILTPSNKKFLGRYSPRVNGNEALLRSGCTFQEEATGKCKVHSIKPLEGRVTCCKKTLPNNSQGLHYSLALKWKTIQSRELIRKWKNEHLKDCELSKKDLSKQVNTLIRNEVLSNL